MAAARARTSDSTTAKPAFDAYAGMLALSLIAMVVATILLVVDYTQYEGKPQLPTLTRGGGGGTPTPPPGGGGGGVVPPQGAGGGAGVQGGAGAAGGAGGGAPAGTAKGP
jgi:hypothetical protein